MECPTDDHLNTYLAGGLLGPELAMLATHCADCPSCRGLVELLAVEDLALLDAPANSREAVAGAQLGRYVLLARIGAGGMGVVWAAYDPVLDRQLAIKLLGNSDDGASPALRSRFEREARITARLQHPAIVHIQEVGMWTNGEPFYVMKLIVGASLDQAIARCATLAERLALLPNVGTVVNALAYAHREGVVHRDLKPQNVVVGEFGETVVIDWGLATRRRAAAPGAGAADPDASATDTRGVLGTPAYMPPEQAAGKDVDERADVYALGAILYHVIAGARPYAGLAAEATLAAVLDGPPVHLATLVSRVPPELLTIVNKAMARPIEDRYRTAKELADELEKFLTGQLVQSHPYSRRELVRRWLLRHQSAIVSVAVVVLAAFAVFGLSRETTVEDTRCQRMEQKLAGVWDPDRAAAVRTAFVASARSYGADTFAHVARQLDDYGREWTAARVEACEANMRGEQSDALLDLRMTCLDRRLVEIGALVDVFAKDPSASVVEKAIGAAGKLSPLGVCSDRAALQAVLPPPFDQVTRAQVENLSRALARAKALADVGRYSDALAIAQPTAKDATSLAYPPLLAAILVLRARLESDMEDGKAAEATFEQALLEAANAHDDALAARIWPQLVFVVGYTLNRPDEALRLLPGARAAIRRAGGAPEAEAGLWNSMGTVFYGQGNYAESVRCHERALALRQQTLAPDHPELGASLNNLGGALLEQAHYDDAQRHFESALRIWEKAFGPEHPAVALCLNNLGILFEKKGKRDEARRYYERALRLNEEAFGLDHPRVAFSLVSLGGVLFSAGSYDEAQRHYERALTIITNTLGPDHSELSPALAGIGHVLEEQGRHEAAQRNYERALAITEKALGAENPDLGYPLVDLGTVLKAQGKYREAQIHYERAIAVWEKALGLEHPDLAVALTGLGDVLLSLRRPDQARSAGERAVAILAKDGGGGQLAAARFVLARALGRDHTRALALAHQARDAFKADNNKVALAKVERWLRTR